MSKGKIAAICVLGVIIVAAIIYCLVPQRPNEGASTTPPPLNNAAGEPKETAGGETAAQQGRERELNIFIWSEYIDLDIIADFEKKFNARIRMDYYESNEEMIAKLQTGRKGVYDIIVPSTYFVPTLINQDLIQALDYSRIPNIVNIDPEYRNLDVDPENKYTVPYQWGTSALVVRADPSEEVPNSWELVYTEDPSQGNFLLFDTARDALGSALKYLGYSYNTTDLAQIEQAGELLFKAKERPVFMGFDSGVGGLSKVMGGIAKIAQVYSGEAIKATKEDPELRYIIPVEGCEIWLDILAIPKNSPNLDVAYDFLNYILEPEVGAKLATFNNYATPNKASFELLPEEEQNDPGVYPPPELKAKMEYMQDLGDANRLYDETWTIVKSR
ncbi:MAG: spermidine/putrescine ABC transporter substrate-binding protein [Deltaproteobacteria bacterium]|jgi:spermidine/putrescine transport system substrate-binding protein|nr:spermidine/putrescine ABC transporter substrate-binding protein [Deltaproteobacteria bacterium]